MLRSAQNFRGSLYKYLKENRYHYFESSSGVDSKYIMHPVQPLGHIDCRAFEGAAMWDGGTESLPNMNHL